MAVLARLFASVLSLTISTVSYACAEEQVVNPATLDAERVEQYKDYFSVTNDGRITEGRIRAPNDPIDYSPLLNDDILRNFALQTLLGCDPVIHYCDDHIYRWSREPILVKLFYEGQSLNEENVHEFSEPFEYVLGATGILADLTADITKASLITYVGSLEYLWKKARDNNDPKAIRHFELLYDGRRKQGHLTQLLGTETEGKSCYTSNKDRAEQRLSRVYLSPSDLSTCFPGALLQIMDLYETDLGVPSVTDASRSFHGLTHFDYFVFRLIEELQEPVMRDSQAVKQALDKRGTQLRQRIDDDWFLSRLPANEQED